MDKEIEQVEPVVEKNLDYYLEHQDEYSDLTDEQVVALSRGDIVDNGETAKDVEAESEDTPDPVAETEPVLLAKDGKHTIPYQELLDAREKSAQLETLAGEQASLIESLKQAKIEDEKTGGTEAQQAVIAEYEGEFPEVVADMKPYFQAMIDAGIKAGMSEIEAKLANVIAPLQKTAADQSYDAHFAAIHASIVDFDQLVESGAVQDWIKTQPKFLQAPANAILEKGTASEVIDLFSAFKASQQATPPSKEAIKQKADAVIAAAKGKTPNSLTDLPSGTIAVIDEVEAMSTMNASQLLQKFEGKTPDQILKLMSKVA